MLTPNELIFYFWRVFMSLPIFVKIDQEMRHWECAQMDRCTEANRFYNLSRVVC